MCQKIVYLKTVATRMLIVNLTNKLASTNVFVEKDSSEMDTSVMVKI